VQAIRADLVSGLKADTALAGARSRVTLRKALVVAQVALSLLLLVGAGLFVRTLQNLGAVDLGFRPEHTIVADVDPSRNGYRGQRLREFYERLRAEVQRVPGVRASTLASITPLTGMSWDEDVSAEGYTRPAAEEPYVNMNAVTPRYFEALGIPVVLGRDFQENDNPATTPDPPQTLGRAALVESEQPGPRVVIVTEALARHFFGGRNPIGLHVCFEKEYDPGKAYEIVGVVKDVHYAALREAPEEMVYLPAWRSRGPERKALVLRTTRDVPGLVETIRRQAAAIDPAVPVLSARTLQQEIDNNVVVERLVTTLSTFFGGLALLLAAIGLYGVMAYTVSRRTREIGIRMALGASRGSVLWLVLRGAVGLVIAGAAIGIPGALFATRVLQAFLFGVTAQDPVTIVAGIAILAAVASLAAFIPARRAASVQPTTALRCE
jgi:predicted permease